MTLDECNEALKDNFNESIQIALELRNLLKEERAALERKDTLSLSETAVRKKVCVTGLEDLDTSRNAISKAFGFGINPDEISKLAAHCDEGQLLSQCWSDFIELAQACSDMNSGNGAIIRVRQQQINGAINLLRDGNAETDTYGPNGQSGEELRTRPLAEA